MKDIPLYRYLGFSLMLAVLAFAHIRLDAPKEIIAGRGLYSIHGRSRPAADPSADLRDSLRNGAPADNRDLATVHAHLATGQQDACSLCHMSGFVLSGKPLWQSPKSWIASRGPAAAIDSPNARDAKICLSCHDGSLGASLSYSLSGEIASATIDPDKSHPVGVDYYQALRAKRGYKDPALDSGIRLDHGKVTCVSCHTAHDSTGGYGPVGSGGRDLCNTCHDY